MKKLIQKLGVTAVMLLTFFSAMAYDFEYDGLYYKILSTADLTCEVVSGDSPYTATSVTIPAKVAYKGRELTVTRIVEAFKGCTSLASVTIPNSVTKIYDYAFSGCTSLASVTIPNSVTYIGRSAFGSCTSLASVTLPNSVTEIGQYAFSGCTSLASVTLSNSVTIIGYYAFSGCTSLASVAIPNSVTFLGKRAFSGCTSLASITIPNSVKIIERYAFNGCTSLASVTIPNSVKIIERYAFNGCTSLASVTIPNSVTKILDYAFYGCGLTSITIPGSVTEIYDGAFEKCSKLSSISFEYSPNYLLLVSSNSVDPFTESVYESIVIGREIRCRSYKNYMSSCSLTFTDFSNALISSESSGYGKYNIISYSSNVLVHLTLGKDVENVPTAMSSCSKLETITLTTSEPPTCPTFSNLQYTDIVVYVPKGSLATYQNAEGWKNFWDIREGEAAGIGDVQVSAKEKTVVGRYDLQGRPVSDSYSGMVVVRYSDGSVRKVMR